jgi:hypothetical protein
MWKYNSYMKLSKPKSIFLMILSLLIAIGLTAYASNRLHEKKFESIEASVKACEDTAIGLSGQMNDFCNGFGDMPFRIVKCGDRIDVCLCGSAKEMGMIE